MTAKGLTLQVAGRSDVGLVREHNEDSFVVVDLATGVLDVSEMRTVDVGPDGAVLLVCDGMGGAAAGEIASAMAVETVSEVMRDSRAQMPPATADENERKIAFARRLRQAALTANDRIFETARKDAAKGGMGTTMTAVGIIGRFLVMAQVGDSRAYLLRAGVLSQLTRDQSLVNELLESGQITEEQAVMFEHSNVILQALGVQKDVEVQLSTIDLRKGDRIVVCSDGLSGVVADEEVGALAGVSDDLAEASRLLIDVARGAGGPDNITAIVARFDGELVLDPDPKEPPVTYSRWRLDEDAPVDAVHAKTTPSSVPTRAPRKHHDPVRTFFSVMVLFSLALGSLVLGTGLYRAAPSGKCTVECGAGVPGGLAIRIDGYDTGERTRAGGVEMRLPVGKHKLTLHDADGHALPGLAEEVDVPSGGSCTARFVDRSASAESPPSANLKAP